MQWVKMTAYMLFAFSVFATIVSEEQNLKKQQPSIQFSKQLFISCMQSAHKNINKKTSIDFFGLSCCWLHLFSLPIQEKWVLDFIPKAQVLISALIFLLLQRQVPFSCVSCPESCVLGLPSPTSAVISSDVPLEGAGGERRSHIICINHRRRTDKGDWTQS